MQLFSAHIEPAGFRRTGDGGPYPRWPMATLGSLALLLVFDAVGVTSLMAQCPTSCPESCGSPYCPYQMYGPVDWCEFPSTGCPPDYHAGNAGSGVEHPGCCCYDFSPILIDLKGGHFDLTSAQDGVVFDIAATGRPKQIAWTTPNSRQGWLALDRNGNELVDNGGELFGNHTPQPRSPDPNGFLALAVYDSPDAGGNADGLIDSQDDVFHLLMIWIDANHDGVCQRPELLTLEQAGITKIDLDFQTVRRTDQHGNIFRYRSKVYDEPGLHVSRWAWDVFLTALPVSAQQR